MLCQPFVTMPGFDDRQSNPLIQSSIYRHSSRDQAGIITKTDGSRRLHNSGFIFNTNLRHGTIIIASRLRLNYSCHSGRHFGIWLFPIDRSTFFNVAILICSGLIFIFLQLMSAEILTVSVQHTFLEVASSAFHSRAIKTADSAINILWKSPDACLSRLK